jgi:hypothetical protein
MSRGKKQLPVIDDQRPSSRMRRWRVLHFPLLEYGTAILFSQANRSRLPSILVRGDFP